MIVSDFTERELKQLQYKETRGRCQWQQSAAVGDFKRTPREFNDSFVCFSSSTVSAVLSLHLCLARKIENHSKEFVFL